MAAKTAKNKRKKKVLLKKNTRIVVARIVSIAMIVSGVLILPISLMEQGSPGFINDFLKGAFFIALGAFYLLIINRSIKS